MSLSYDILRYIFLLDGSSPDSTYIRAEVSNQIGRLECHVSRLSCLSKAFAATNSNTITLLHRRIRNLRKLLQLLCKYGAAYQIDYEETGGKIPPLLYDALLSGCTLPFCKHSCAEVDLNDVQHILRLCPESVQYVGGYARCRWMVGPMWAVYFNTTISFANRKIIVQWLMEHGLSIEDTIKVNGVATTIEDDYAAFELGSRVARLWEPRN